MTEELRGWLLNDVEMRKVICDNPEPEDDKLFVPMNVGRAVVRAEAKHLMQWLDTAGCLQHRVLGDRGATGEDIENCPVCQIMKELGL